MSLKKISTGRLALFFLLIIVLLVGAEWGYRLLLVRKYAKIIAVELEEVPCTYRVCPSMHVEYDNKYGEHPKPNHVCWFSNVADGKVIDGDTVFISNADRLDGRTTRSEYAKADHKILAFGDSFTHWNQGGVTWPDVLQGNLNTEGSEKTAVLNYGRGAYGLVQMLELAADKIDELKPDLVIFATDKSNIANTRWWSYETPEDGYTRWILSSKNGENRDYWFTGDLAQITVGTTPEWCKKQMASPNPNDPILKKANAQFLIMNEKNVRQQYHIPLITWDHSYLLARIMNWAQFPPKGFFPQLEVNDFGADKRTAENLRRIKASKVPVMLVYLPSMAEIKDKRDTVYYIKQKQDLLKSLEKQLDEKFFFIHKEYKCPLPAKIDMFPFDMHPNHAGLKFYADAITPTVKHRLHKEALTSTKQK